MLRKKKPQILVVGETGVSRDMKITIQGSNTRTYTFPRTVTEVQPYAFDGMETLLSVRPNEGLETLGSYAFSESGLKSFVAPASLKSIEERTFAYCKNLRHADFSASILRPEDG